MNRATEIDPPRRVAMMIYDHVAAVDVSGPLEVFGLANFLTGRRLYQTTTVSVDGAAVEVAGGYLRIEPTCGVARLPARVDLFLVAGGPGYRAAAADRVLLRWLREIEPRCRRIGAVCTGSTILQAAGLARGHRVATHWLEAMRLGGEARRGCEVDADAIYVRSGKLWTSAGMLAGIDLALALVEADHGRQLALDIARFMVLALRRRGGQSQFSRHLRADVTEDPQVRRVQLHVWQDPAGEHTVPALAAAARTSERSLLRRFKKVTGTTLARFVEDVRLNHARHLLETTALSVGEVAAKAGFGTDSTMRRVFARRLGTAPAAYRADFGLGAATPAPEGGHAASSPRMDLEHVVSGRAVW